MTDSNSSIVGLCPKKADEVDLFAPGAQAYWYDSYAILHNEAPVLKLKALPLWNIALVEVPSKNNLPELAVLLES